MDAPDTDIISRSAVYKYVRRWTLEEPEDSDKNTGPWEPWQDEHESSLDTFYALRLGLISEAVLCRRLDLGEAQWAMRLKPALGALDPFVQWLLVIEYARRDRISRRFPDQCAETDDLDLITGVQPWANHGDAILNELWLRKIYPRPIMFGAASVWPFDNPNLREWIIGTLNIPNEVPVFFPVAWIAPDLASEREQDRYVARTDWTDRKTFDWIDIIGVALDRNYPIARQRSSDIRATVNAWLYMGSSKSKPKSTDG